MDNKGYYKTLEVPENATDDQIRSQYKRLALKWHPDRWVNGTDEEKKTAEDNFKKINEAYSVLSDKQKRQQYDSGIEGDWSNAGGFDPFEFIRKHFGGMGPFGDFGMGDGGPAQPANRGYDVDVNLTLTMDEANNGVSKDITYEIREKCEKCNGTGFGKDGRMETCPHCNGRGRYVQYKQSAFGGHFQIDTPCPFCNSTGKTMKNPCPECGGSGLSRKTRKETVGITIPVGIAPGETLVVQGLGEHPERNDGVRGDLRIHVTIAMPHGYQFMDNMGGVKCEMDVPFYDAMLGCEKQVLFPNGKVQTIKIDGGTKNGRTYSYKGEGMRLKDGKARSSFDVVVNYTTPDGLTKKQEELLKEFKKISEND